MPDLVGRDEVDKCPVYSGRTKQQSEGNAPQSEGSAFCPASQPVQGV